MGRGNLILDARDRRLLVDPVRLYAPTERRARAGQFRAFRELVSGEPSKDPCSGLQALLKVWSDERDRGRVFLCLVPSVPGLPPSERELQWLGHAISIREACTSVQGAEVRVVILRDESEQQHAAGVFGGAGLMTSTYLLPRMTMGKLGQLMRSWDTDRPLIVIVDSLGGIIAPPKCWQDGPGYRNWWTVGKHVTTMLTTMQHSIDLQPFLQRIALVVLFGAVTYESLSDEYRDAIAAMFPLTYVR